MKTLAVSVLATAALILASTSCGKHDWDETKVLHEGMHKHDDHAKSGHDSHSAGHGDAKPHGDAHAPAAPADAHAPAAKPH